MQAVAFRLRVMVPVANVLRKPNHTKKKNPAGDWTARAESYPPPPKKKKRNAKEKKKRILELSPRKQDRRRTYFITPSLWRLQPLYRPNQPSVKTRADHHIQVANRTLWPASAPEANWHHGLCTLRLQRSRTDGPPHPPGLSRLAETETPVYGRRMSQPLTSCGERRKTCAAPPNSWQHVD